VSTFAIVVIVVAVVGIALALTPWFSISRVLSGFGRHGKTWMDHQDDQAIEDRPTGDEQEAPIPARPLRGRPQPPPRGRPLRGRPH
jgi:hypothetical protein